ncbi:protein trichome berefringence-like 7 [Sesamum alatum]|uniref:Protein trichome berefringence-like 7 n=1 Tax=Sesamum alatum TaxID=300844 RepID=A0AAE1YH94_9LAMI|nr:protein trichome berefringence-like 7 [Sesamum alatum]
MITTGSRQNCKVTKQPSLKTKGRQKSSISDAIINVVKNVAIPVKLLHVTPMGAFRSDAHVDSWSDNPSVPDCSQWCLPGVPDMWNELLFSFCFHSDGIFPHFLTFHCVNVHLFFVKDADNVPTEETAPRHT